MNNKLIDILETICVILGITLLFALLFFIISIIMGYVMQIFGFEYDSLSSLFWYFIYSALLGLPMEVFSVVVPNVLLTMDIINLTFARLIFLILDICSTIIAMVTIDDIMPSVSATTTSIIVFSLITALCCLSEIKKIEDID